MKSNNESGVLNLEKEDDRQRRLVEFISNELNAYQSPNGHEFYELLLNLYYFKPVEILRAATYLIGDTNIDQNKLKDIYILASISVDKRKHADPNKFKQNLIIERFSPFYDNLGELAIGLTLMFFFLDLTKSTRGYSEIYNDMFIMSSLHHHIGNASGASIASFLSIGPKRLLNWATDHLYHLSPSDLSRLEHSIRTTLEIVNRILPYLVITLLLIYQIDSETLVSLPGNFGTPDLLDLPVGLISVIAAARAIEKNQLYPMVGDTSKVEESIDKGLLKISRYVDKIRSLYDGSEVTNKNN